MGRFDRYTVVRTFKNTTDVHTKPFAWILDKETEQALAYIKTLSPIENYSEDTRYDYRVFLINGYQLNFSELGKSFLSEHRCLSDMIDAVTQINLIQRLREQSYYRIVLLDQGEEYLLSIDEGGYCVVHGHTNNTCIFTRGEAEQILRNINARPDTVRHGGCDLFTPFDVVRLHMKPMNPNVEALLSARLSNVN